MVHSCCPGLDIDANVVVSGIFDVASAILPHVVSDIDFNMDITNNVNKTKDNESQEEDEIAKAFKQVLKDTAGKF